MPTIECHCHDCGHRFLHLTFRGDPVTPVCPQCAGTRIRTQSPDEGFMAEAGMGAQIVGVPKGPS